MEVHFIKCSDSALSGGGSTFKYIYYFHLSFTLQQKQAKRFCLTNFINNICLIQHDIFGDVTFGVAIANMCLSYIAIGLSKLTFFGQWERKQRT